MAFIPLLAEISSDDVLIFSLVILTAFFVLFGIFWFGWWLHNRPSTLSPYSGFPLRRASGLSYYSIERVLRYVYELQDYDNQIFELRKSSFCRETGRIFPKSVTWYDVINVDWNFLQKRYPGKYVSWGSLTPDQQLDIRDKHEGMEGFQTEFSSKNPVPRAIEPEYAFRKPGPLYVDIETHVLLGWKLVPGTELEILIVQKPKKPARYTPRTDL